MAMTTGNLLLPTRILYDQYCWQNYEQDWKPVIANEGGEDSGVDSQDFAPCRHLHPVPEDFDQKRKNKISLAILIRTEVKQDYQSKGQLTRFGES